MDTHDNYQSVYGRVTLTGVSNSSTLLDDANFPDGFTILSANVYDTNTARSGVTYLNCSTNGASGYIDAMSGTSSPRFSDTMALYCSLDLRLDSTVNGSHDVYYNITYVPYNIASSTSMDNLVQTITLGQALISLVLLFAIFYSIIKNR